MKIPRFKFTPRHRQLLGLIRNQRLKLAGGMLCMLVLAASTSASAFLVKPVMDDIFVNKNNKLLMIIPLAVVALYLLRGAGMYGKEYLMSYVGQEIIMQLRCLLYEKIQSLPLAFFHRERTGVLMSRITNDVNIVREMVSTAVTSALRDVFTIAGLTFVIFYRDWKMALFAMVILPVAFFPIVEFGRRIRRVSTGCQEAMADLNALLHETFAGSKIVKAFGMENYENRRFRRRARDLFELEVRSARIKSLSSPVMEFLAGLGIAFIIWYGGYRVINGTSTPGTFFSFLTAVLFLYDPVKKLTRLNNAIQEGLAAVDRIFNILERENEIRDPKQPVVLEPGPHAVSFAHVDFKYDDDLVLRGINLEAQAGEVLALVGMSGGGKTSLVNLIPRFYDVSDGRVCVDGIDVRQLSVRSLRSQIAIVTQEPILFNDSVRNNIAYGNPDASLDDIESASRAAYAYDFIRQFPRGFDTNIGELGGRLSGGEKQRICIARALLKDAPILILDEATSSLDSESEMLVQKALGNLMKGRTTFVIAHRLSTTAYADRILVIVNGRIVEQGRHQELLSLDGEYCKLYKMQYDNGV
jgi:subfamily B ATP-binding cassette protein MsbA